MDSTRFRLPPPPKHPQSFSAAPSTIARNSPSPNPDSSQSPAIPPRPIYSYSLASDEVVVKGLAQNTSSSQQLRPPIPPRHPPPLSEQSSRSTSPVLVPEHRSIPPPMPMRPTRSSIPITSALISHSDPQPDLHEVPRISSALLGPHAENSPPEDTPKPIHSQNMGPAFETSLSDRELRDLYDDEEISRFLRLFSAHVNEVKLQDSSAADTQFSAENEGSLVERDPAEDGEWTRVNDSTPSFPSSKPSNQQNLCLSERIVVNYVIPLLPLVSPPVPPFTIERLKITTQRLFLALEPVYRFLISHLVHLATWQDKPLSLRYCIGFWILWLYDLLLPSFMLYLLYTLLHHKIHPYPTLQELREHRNSIDKAKEFGDILQLRLESYPAFGVREAWRMFRESRKLTKTPAKSDRKVTEETDPVDLQDATLFDDLNESKKESDIKAIALEGMTELTDNLEKLKNIFLWRRPASSYAFGLVLGAMFLVTLLLPAKYLAKLVYFIGGVAFWHVPPIILAIPPEDRRRFVSLLHQVPTDADYAMQLISQRVASGQEIKPLQRRKRSKISTSSSREDFADSSEAFTKQKGSETKAKRKLKKGVAIFTTLASEGAKAVTGESFLHNAFSPEVAKEAGGQTRTYPAQYGKTPGVITITSTTLFFTVLMSSNAKVVVPLDQITGIKKGFSKAISVQLKELQHGGEQRVERFLWVYERDDLFARLVGLGGRKWLKV